MSEKITIHGYPNGGVPGSKPRVPMVHLLSYDHDVQSIDFHPDHAEEVARAILRAAKAAKAGRKIRPVTIDLQ